MGEVRVKREATEVTELACIARAVGHVSLVQQRLALWMLVEAEADLSEWRIVVVNVLVPLVIDVGFLEG